VPGDEAKEKVGIKRMAKQVQLAAAPEKMC
jgi:hypothetical protein